MPKLPSAYRGAGVLIAVGLTFAILGLLPLAITLAIDDSRSSATIIGIGFIGFGILLILPGICWCFLVYHSRSTWWRRKRHPGDENLQQPALSKQNGSPIKQNKNLLQKHTEERADEEEFDDINNMHDDQQKLHTTALA